MPYARARLALACLLLNTGLAAHADTDADAARRIEADVRFLADDLLEGREPGKRGHELAARFVASRFAALGLEGGGDGGSFFQAVPLVRGTREQQGSPVRIERGGKQREMRFADECLPGVSFSNGSAEVTAPLVFVGHGVRAPELGYDDFKGVDIKGGIAVLFGNAPASFPIDQRAFHADSNEKFAELERLGAVGVIAIYTPVDEKSYPWKRVAENWQRPSMRVLDAEGHPLDEFPGLRVRASCSTAAAAAIFEGSAHPLPEILQAFEQGKLKAFDLGASATLTTRARLERLQSPNVIARLPGAEGALAREHIVFTAHLDHLGVGAPRNGDAIYNGALDNALGVSTLLESARVLAAQSPRPARSMLFVATTAEEPGLLGARFFALSPPVPSDSLIAEINMDMPMAFGDLGDVVAIGNEHSSLQQVVERAVADAGLVISPDPYPEEVLFIRSDQYSLVRAGIPSINIDAGYKPRDGSDGLARQRTFLTERYHQPGDDTSVPVNWGYTARLARLNQRIALTIANDPQRPRWNKRDFFGSRFAK